MAHSRTDDMRTPPSGIAKYLDPQKRRKIAKYPNEGIGKYLPYINNQKEIK